MCKKKGTKTINIFHRKNFSGDKNNKRVTCKLCGVKHYESKYHYCVFKPDLLDLYCCAGGAGFGYYKAGFNVVGVDLVNRKNYFCDFIMEDAIKFLSGGEAAGYKFIHASPPCQKFSRSTAPQRALGKNYIDLVDETRQLLISSGVPFCIENVTSAPLRKDLLLRGEMFGLKVIRERIFEFGNFDLSIMDRVRAALPPFRKISVLKGEAVMVFGKACYHKTGHGRNSDPGKKLIIPDWRLDTVRKTWSLAMGNPNYLTDLELSESIPPAYTEFIGRKILELVLD